MEIARTQELLRDLERAPERVQLYRSDLERCIAWCMDAIYEVAKRGDDDDRKMQMVGLEYRARLLLERLKKTGLN